MTEYLTEQEQIELLKNWIKQYSLVIIIGVLLAIVAITGWRYWQQRQAKILSHASSVYDEMLTMRAQKDREATYIQANKLFSHYSKTVYGQMAALMLARDAILKKDYNEAEKQLRWVIDQSAIPSFEQIARLRLARLLISQQKSEEALAILSKVRDKTFNGLINEVRGDAYFAMKKMNEARQAYGQAITDLPNAEVMRPLLQMKYDNLAPSTTSPR